MAQEITTSSPRLRMPANLDGIDAGRWRVLCDVIFPNAKSAESIELALVYCRARNLDILKKPIHIVPMWSSALGKNVETIWPAINEIQITASRTGAWAGMDAPVWGETTEITLTGKRKTWRNRVETIVDDSQTFRVPAWCSVTVYRLVHGARYAFTEPVYWLEAYGRVGNTELANDMWRKRPHGQLHKVAKAASLRAAFPEEGEYSAEEMEGQALIEEEIQTRSPAAPSTPAVIETVRAPDPPHDPETGEIQGPHEIQFRDNPDTNEPERWPEWGSRFIAALRTSETAEQTIAWENLNGVHIAEMKVAAPKVHEKLIAAINLHRQKLENPNPEKPSGSDASPPR